tara:strand:+ start:184 stop:1089 length:906 start_codon:yes stop_codon:yes gene_type:complete
MNFEIIVKKIPSHARETLISTLSGIQSEHQGWLNQVCQIVSNRTQSLAPSIEEKDSHHLCGFGRWIKSLSGSPVLSDPAFEVLQKHHTTMHNHAREINESIRTNKDVKFYFESFLIEQFHFHNALSNLIQSATKHYALFGLKNELIKACYVSDIISYAQDSLKSLPSEEQSGCIAIVGISNLNDVNHRFGPEATPAFVDMLSQRLSRTMRQSDRAVEYANNRILLVFPGMPIKNISSIMERILGNIQASPLTYLDKQFSFELACGVTELTSQSFGNECIEATESAYNNAIASGRKLVVSKV